VCVKKEREREREREREGEPVVMHDKSVVVGDSINTY